ncbi:hypothetical protein L202_05472 [Cryptococcus amylolentus CBS 6039]|uniref:Uncharacterized protein n=2 Tax=Cryptococcus amylolentus TaxID=104669 RepID=A0A1E3HKM0_9TREE|nr:hypothetical protein L202_05472 [Cryptococcus amylolentus CBS 6039]ODN76888.1 hypothetical protein L202_05472 [Cryptococcus amylolentus CBS 6039]ODO04791.1 hypothetical protein I350_05401 [Cryptococcus amylolentus CBS 6273]
MSASSIKQRHYSALASRIRVLQSNLAETEGLTEMMAYQLDATAKLGIHCGSQFMAVSRLLDKELEAVQEASEQPEGQSTTNPPESPL